MISWCEEHGTVNRPSTLGCWIGFDLWEASGRQGRGTCRMVEKNLVSTTPAGYLIYGEFIPYEVWIEWLEKGPFAAPTDQVVALYAEEGP